MSEPELYEEKRLEVIKDVGLFGLKALLSLNSGGALALIALSGRLVDEKSDFSAEMKLGISDGLFAFFVGLLFTLASVVVTYLIAQRALLINRKDLFLGILVLPPSIAGIAFLYGVYSVVIALTHEL